MNNIYFEKDQIIALENAQIINNKIWLKQGKIHDDINMFYKEA
jgi:hypothetical protein